MTAALELASAILTDQPESASSLFHLIVWMRSNRGDPIHEAEADSVEEFVYSKTEDCAKHLEAHKKRLLIQPVSATSTGS